MICEEHHRLTFRWNITSF